VPSILYIVTSLESSPETYKNFPEGSTVSQAGSIPAAKGEPATSCRAAGRRIHRVAGKHYWKGPFATYANFPDGSIEKWKGSAPVGKRRARGGR